MNPIVQLAANALPGEKKYILLAGAGVSKDAGIPTSWDLMLKTASLIYIAENSKDTSETFKEVCLNISSASFKRICLINSTGERPVNSLILLRNCRSLRKALSIRLLMLIDLVSNNQ